MRIATVLACLTLFGCEASPGSHSANSNKKTPIGVEVNATDTKTDNAGDDAGKDGANNGSTDTGSDAAPNNDTASPPPKPESYPCQYLQVIAGTWYRIGGGGKMEVTLKEEGDTCAVTTDGEGAISHGGTIHGTQLPLKFEDDGWEFSIYLKKDDRLVQKEKQADSSFQEWEYYR